MLNELERRKLLLFAKVEGLSLPVPADSLEAIPRVPNPWSPIPREFST